MDKKSTPRRAIGLDIVIAFLVAATLIAVTVGIALLFPGTFLERLWQLNPEARAAFESMGRFSSLLLFMVAAVAAGAAVGLRKRRQWGWRLAVLLFAVNVAGDVVSLFAMKERRWKGIFGVLIGGAFLFYLMRSEVRQALNGEPVAPADPR